MIASNNGKSNVLAITSISTEERKCYILPDELKLVIHHTYIVKMNTFPKIKNSMKKKHQSRKIWIKLDEDQKKAYIDEEGNIQFLNQYLKEMSTKQPKDKEDNLKQILEKLIESTTKKENQHNLKNVSEKFIIEKFTSKTTNAMQWKEKFEKDCERFNITKDETKIEILRLFLEKSCLDWYSSMAIKLTINSEWKDKFLETFKYQGVEMVTYAFAFRYKEGLLIDYALKKERLILDAFSVNFSRNTMFEVQKIRHYTWVASVDTNHYQINYILAKSCFKNQIITNQRLLKTEIDNNHNLIVTTYRIHKKITKLPKHKICVEKFKNKKTEVPKQSS